MQQQASRQHHMLSSYCHAHDLFLPCHPTNTTIIILATGIETYDLHTLLANTFTSVYRLCWYPSQIVWKKVLSLTMHLRLTVCTADRWQVDDFDRNHNVNFIIQCTCFNLIIKPEYHSPTPPLPAPSNSSNVHDTFLSQSFLALLLCRRHWRQMDLLFRFIW